MNDQIGRPPVDALSDVAWARIERSVFTRLDHGAAARAVTSLDERRARRAWPWIALPVAFAAAIALVLVLTRPAAIVPGDGPSRVVAGDAPSDVSFADAQVSLDAKSAVVLEHDNSGSPTVLLERGAAWFSVAPRGQRPPFLVLAGDATVRVIGTRFRVARVDEKISVSVDHGLVEVQFRGGVVKIGANASWSSDAPTEVAVSMPIPPPEPAPAPVAAPTPPAPVVPHTPAHHHKPRPAPVASASSADPDERQFFAIQKIEAKNASLAIKEYLVLSKGDGKWAGNALYAAALLSEKDDPAKAITFAQIYLKRFPNGPLAPDAQRLIDSLQGKAP